MGKKLLAAGIITAMTLASTVAFAGDVVVTKRGKSYHTATCSLIKNRESTTIDEQQAQAKGLKPCGKCMGDKEVKK